MTVAQFQRIHEISETTPDSIEQLGWMVCEVFDKTYEQVDDMSAKRFARYASKLEKALQVKKPLWFTSLKFQTDATKITFGQFVEVQHWLKQDLPAVLDLVAASVMLERTDHKEDATWIREQPLRNVLLPVKAFVESLGQLTKSYSGLFGTDEEEDEDEIKPMKKGPDVHPFVSTYGWIYSATEVAQHEGIKLDEAYELPVIQALNDLSYLKAKQQYNKHLSKR